jgi:hypothetical protein
VDLGAWVLKFLGVKKVTFKIFLAAILWSIWKTINRACFDNVLPHDSCEILF